jgi:hypothetical protein
VESVLTGEKECGAAGKAAASIEQSGEYLCLCPRSIDRRDGGEQLL